MDFTGPNLSSPPYYFFYWDEEEEEEEQKRVAAAQKTTPTPRPSQTPLACPGEEGEEEIGADGSSRHELQEDTVHREETTKNQGQYPSNNSDSLPSAASDSDWRPESEYDSLEKPTPVATPASSCRKRRNAPSPLSEEDLAKKQNPFRPFWRKDDDVKILKGMLAYHARRGTDPSCNSNMKDLHEFMKRFLGFEFTQLQLRTKIRSLKNRHDSAASRGINDEEAEKRSFYKLSAKIWGGRKTAAAKRKLEGRCLGKRAKKRRVSLEVDYKFLGNAVAKFREGKVDRLALDEALRLVDAGKATAVEKQLRELEIAKMKNYLLWLYAMQAATQLMVDSFRKRG